MTDLTRGHKAITFWHVALGRRATPPVTIDGGRIEALACYCRVRVLRNQR